MRRYTKRLRIDSKKFVEAYMNSDFNWQVAEKLNISLDNVGSKAAILRSKGVNLPFRFPRDDVEELNEIIAKIEDLRDNP